VGNEGALALARSPPYLQHITSLGLQGNDTDGEGGKAILERFTDQVAIVDYEDEDD
jgi:hypothetical protein